jgi:hypothetical protein
MMKTSSKLILTAFILVVASMVIYDMTLRASYLRGDYKKPYRDFVNLNFKDFKAIDLEASTVANIIVKQGPFSVKIAPEAKDFVKVSQEGDTLVINGAFAGSYYNIRPDYIIVISCPNLAQLNADSRYMAGGKLVIDSMARWDFLGRTNVINGFKEDSLAIQEQHGSSIILSGNKIRAIKAVVGIGDKCRSNILITDDNQLENADLDILNYSQLQLHNAHIGNFKYKLADSAKLIQYGGTPNIYKK